MFVHFNKNLKMFVQFADLVKVLNADLHDDCWEEVYNKYKNK